MPAPDPYLLAPPDQQFTSANWQELAANYSPNTAALFGPNGGEAPLVGQVDYLRKQAALRFFLGYNNITPVYPPAPPPAPQPAKYFLQRTPPVYHPDYPRLVCVSVGAEDFHLKPRDSTPPSARKVIKIPQTSLPPLPAREPPAPPVPSNFNTIDGTPLNFKTSYNKTKITARFAPVPYRMLGDTEVQAIGRGEWDRWCYIDQEPRTEILSLSGFNQIYTEGDGFPKVLGIQTVSNPKGKAYPADVGTVLIKSDLQVNWLSVPEGWVFQLNTNGDVTNFPRNILWGLGTVNKTNWNGYLAGTLLLNGVRFQRRPWSLAAGTEYRFNYDITFLMSYFDPEKGYSKIGGVDTQLNRLAGDGEPLDPRGHNCAIWSGNFAPTDINAGKWFFATYNGSDTGTSLFRKTDFAKLFDSPLNPYS